MANRLDIPDALDANRRNWDEKVPVHAVSRLYDVDGFKAGRSSLLSVELEEVVDVAGKSLLHLQCHFGMDTMSWARLGAKVTGVDFSEEAIALARSLSEELGIDADFVVSNIADSPQALAGQFDIVFTSYGVLVWLPDLKPWAEAVAHFLKPGGFFYVVDHHPFAHIFYNEDDATDLRPHYRYSVPANEPIAFPPGPTYTDGPPMLLNATYEWNHGVGDVLNSLISAGLTIEFFHEFHFSSYRAFPMMEKGDDGWWRLPEHQESVPLLYSVKATKPLEVTSR